MGSKKRKPGKSAKRGQRSGLSGNPQLREQQLQERLAADLVRWQFPEVSFLGSSHKSWPWWDGSHEKVLAEVLAASWPDRLLDIEGLAGQLAGDEFCERLNAPDASTGMIPAGWLRALAGKALKAMSADLADDGKEWPKLWAFCCGLADEELQRELAVKAGAIAGAGLAATPGIPVPWYQPTAETDVLVARDIYGARFLLVAPFSDPGQPAVPDHWYAWDLDWCVDDFVAAAGAYGSAGEALAEWRASGGPAVAASELACCPAELCVRLLVPAMPGSIQTESVIGNEPAEFLREIPRLMRRASTLTAALERRLTKVRSSLSADFRDAAVEDFLDWHIGRPGNIQDEVAEPLDLLLAEWGPDVPPDERSFYSCSPHRIQACAAILRDGYEPDWVNATLPLLPSWTEWCATKISLDDEAAARALAAARAEALDLASEARVFVEDEAPFRRPEY